MKRFMGSLLLALPYLVALILVLAMLMVDGSFFGAPGIETVFNYVMCGAALACIASILYAVVLCKHRESGRNLMFWAMLIKLCHIPYYAATFILGALFLPHGSTDLASSLLVVINGLLLITTASYSIAGIVRMRREGALRTGLAVICGVLSFVFCADAVCAVILYVRVRAHELKGCVSDGKG